MNVVYAGYRKWAYEIVRDLLKKRSSQYSIRAVLTNEAPEAPFLSLPADVFSINPIDLDSKKNKLILSKLRPDVFLFYGWSWKIPKEIFERYPCLILHTSPLPKYRGGSPLQHQIIRGETVSAISIFQATEGIDEGPIYAQKTFSLEGNIENIFTCIVKEGIRETKKVLKGLSNKTLTPTKQSESKKTYFKRRKPQESELTVRDLQTKTARELYNFIRALGDPYPNAFIKCKDGGKLFFKEVAIEK